MCTTRSPKQNIRKRYLDQRFLSRYISTGLVALIYEYYANGERMYCSEAEGDTDNVYQQQQQQQQQPRNGVPPPSSTTASPTKSQVGFIEKILSAIK